MTAPQSVGGAFAAAGRKLIGLALIALVAVPAFRILDPADFMQRLMSESGLEHWRYAWAGFALAFGGAALVALLTDGRAGGWLAMAGRRLSRVPRGAFAAGVGVIAAGLTAWVTFAVFDTRTILNDASVQLIQARYLAAGHLAGPVLELPEFFSVQFMVLTEAGWVSQYPPGHALLLALGFRLGAPWIATVLAMGVMGVLLVLSLERLLPDRPAVARLAAVLGVASPMLLALAAGYMNHATLAFFAVLALYLGLRADEGGWGWAVAAGAAMGWMVTIRPVTGILIGASVTLGLWLRPGRTRAWMGRRIAGWVAGGVPFALGFGLFNARFFGSPFTLGYVAASGPNHGLGFHEDPWGRLYTPIQAVGYSSAELVSLGRELLGGPVPLAAVIGVFLLVAPRLERGVRVIAAWALLPLLASALYWHHDLVFGPRMLGEAAPAWTALAVIATAGLIARVAPDRGGRGARWAGDALALAAVFVLGYGLAVGAPGRLARFTGRLGARPHVEASNAPTLAFVHEPWADRLGGRLAGRGMRLDSIRTVLTRFHPCQVEAGLDGIPPSRAGPVCEREQAADRLPSLGITSLLWMGDLPGLPAEGVMWARDLGPERNLALIGLHPGRVPKVLLPPPAAGGEWRLVPYEEGMSAIWPPAPD